MKQALAILHLTSRQAQNKEQKPSPVAFLHLFRQVFLSTRTGAWVVNRVSDNGYPLDVVHFTRFKNMLRHLLPLCLMNQWGENKLNARFNHENYGVKPQFR